MVNNCYFACRIAKKGYKCHPKKSFQPLPGQKKLSFRGQQLHTNDDEPKSVPESDSVAGSASTSDNDSEKKKGNSFHSGGRLVIG